MLNLTYNEMLSAYSEYPAPMRPYLLRAQTHPVLREKLPKSVMRAFIDLLARANITNPMRAIQVRMDKTAERLGISSKTVSRTIKEMKKNAWLAANPAHDGRNWRGEYAGQEFILSDDLRKLIGLPTRSHLPTPPGAGASYSPDCEADSPRSTPAPYESAGPDEDACNGDAEQVSSGTLPPVSDVDNSEPKETEMSDGEASYPQKSDQKFGNETEMSDGHIGVNNRFIKKEASFKAEALLIENEGPKPIRIPADLADMYTVFGITGKGICGLMRLAKEKHQRLQDIWKVKKEQLSKAGATGGRAVLYLRSLLLSGEDFAYVARNMPADPGSEAGPAPASSDTTSPTPAADQSCPPSIVGDRVDPRTFINLYDYVKKCAFKKFRHVSNGLVVRFYDGTADVSQGTMFSVYAGWEMMRNLYLGVARGNLVEVTE